ncbi:MAG: hypothetical protein AAGB29_09255 [Planctomycetota bacterium]
MSNTTNATPNESTPPMSQPRPMDRTTAACYALIASAAVLAGLLVFGLDRRWASEADASLVIAQQNFTLLTTQTRNTEEALVVLDNTSASLLVYRLNVPRKQLEAVGGYDVRRIFAQSIPR